jgi:phosphoserine phosphatase
MTKKIAIVDFDGTLIRGDSTKMFYRHVYRGWLQFLWAYYLANFLGLIILVFFQRESYLKKKRLRRIEKLINMENLKSFTKVLNDDLNTSVLNKIADNAGNLDEVVIVTAGVFELIKPIAVSLGYSLIAKSLKDTTDDSYNFEEKLVKINENYPDAKLLLAFGNSPGDYAMLRASSTAWLVSLDRKIEKFV